MLDFAKLFFQQLHGLPSPLRYAFVALFFTSAILFMLTFKRWLESRQQTKDTDFWSVLPVGMSMGQLALWIVWATACFYTSYNEPPKVELAAVAASASTPAPAPAGKSPYVPKKPVAKKHAESSAHAASVPAPAKPVEVATQSSVAPALAAKPVEIAPPAPAAPAPVLPSPAPQKMEAAAPKTEPAPAQAPAPAAPAAEPAPAAMKTEAPAAPVAPGSPAAPVQHHGHHLHTAHQPPPAFVTQASHGEDAPAAGRKLRTAAN